MVLKSYAKFEGELSCRFKIDIEEFDEFSPEHSKVSKIYPLMGSF